MITYKLLTNQGNRSNNEDSIGSFQLENSYCFVLADGLGGHGKGEVASEFVVGNVISIFGEKGLQDEFLEKALQDSQDNLLEMQIEANEKNGMKTTAVIFSIDQEKAIWGHVGDSRLYYFEQSKVIKRTLDHSVPQMLCATGEIKDKDIRNHPDRNRLLKVMGIEWDRPKYEISEPVEVKQGQSFLLCSDGFWELIDENKMCSCLKKAKNVEEWILEMEKIVLKNGKNVNMDNYSAIGIWIR